MKKVNRVLDDEWNIGFESGLDFALHMINEGSGVEFGTLKEVIAAVKVIKKDVDKVDNVI
jgi:hypothetical protein